MTTAKFKCRQCRDTGLLPGAPEGEVCACLYGARIQHAARYPDVKRCENCNCTAPPCSYALQAATMMAPFRPVEAPRPALRRRPTIYEALRAKLGREPTSTELKADVSRIMADVDAAAKRAPVSP